MPQVNRFLVKLLLDRALRPTNARVPLGLALHVATLLKLDMSETEALMGAEGGLRHVGGQCVARQSDSLPSVEDVVEAIPGPMTDAEFAKVLSGGTRTHSGSMLRRYNG